MPTPYENACPVVESKTSVEVEGVLLDYLSACAIKAVYENGSQRTKDKLDSLTTVKAAIVCLKVINKLREANQ